MSSIASLFYTITIYPLYTIIEFIYMFCNKIAPHEGFAVIGVSAGVSLLCLPLYAVAEHWQEIERKTEKRLKPGLERIKKTFSGDERYMMSAAYYQENHYAPIMALRSSFGLLIQIPFFIAAYRFLSNLEAIRGEDFFFIRDMGSPDAMFHLGTFPVNVLPIAMTLINIVAGAIYTTGHPFKEKLQIYGMALLFLVVLYSSPSGLVLYWTMNNVFSLIKNIFYRFKRPLKAFWLCICALCIAIFIFLSKLPVPLVYKCCFIALSIIIFLLPLIRKKGSPYVMRSLRPLREEKAARFSIFIFSCLLLFLLTGIAIPTSLIASSPIEFSTSSIPHPLGHIPTTLFQAAGFFLFWPLCIYFLFSSKVQSFLAVFLSIISLSALVNAYIFMLPYGDISSSLCFLDAVNFRTFSFISLVNIGAIILLAVLLCFLIMHDKKKIVIYTISIICLAEIFISARNSISITARYTAYKNSLEDKQDGLNPIFHLSKNKQNVVLIMLDAGQGHFMNDILTESPDLRSTYSGFVFYNNVISFNGHTLLGAPGIYGGYEYTPREINKRSDVLLKDKNNEAELLLPRIFTENLGFTAVTTDPSWGNYSIYPDLTAFDAYPDIQAYKTIGSYSDSWYLSEKNKEHVDNTPAILRRNLLFFSFFRSVPIFLREAVYYKGKYWNSSEDSQYFQTVIDNYAVLDFLPQLTTVAETEKGSYTCIVNELAHCSAFMQAPDFIPTKYVTDRGSSRFSGENDYHTQMAALKRIGTWLNYLKEMGVYDNTRIIIVSDHGRWGHEPDMEPNPELDSAIHGSRYMGRGHYHCLLLYKDFQAGGDIAIDEESFMTNADAPSLALKGLIAEPVNPFTQKVIPLDTRPLKENGVLISTCDNHQAWLYKNDYTHNISDNEWWLVKDNIFQAKNWTQVKDGQK